MFDLYRFDGSDRFRLCRQHGQMVYNGRVLGRSSNLHVLRGFRNAGRDILELQNHSGRQILPWVRFQDSLQSRSCHGFRLGRSFNDRVIGSDHDLQEHDGHRGQLCLTQLLLRLV